MPPGCRTTGPAGSTTRPGSKHPPGVLGQPSTTDGPPHVIAGRDGQIEMTEGWPHCGWATVGQNGLCTVGRQVTGCVGRQIGGVVGLQVIGSVGRHVIGRVGRHTTGIVGQSVTMLGLQVIGFVERHKTVMTLRRVNRPGTQSTAALVSSFP